MQKLTIREQTINIVATPKSCNINYAFNYSYLYSVQQAQIITIALTATVHLHGQRGHITIDILFDTLYFPVHI